MRSWGELRPVDAVRAVGTIADPDPRVLQTAFAAVVLADLGILATGVGDPRLGAWPGLGLALVLFATVFAFAVPWRRFPASVVAVLPVLDLAALGAARMNPEGSAAGLLLVVPALWLGGLLGRAGAVVAAVATAVLTGLPGLLVVDASALAVSRTVLITLIAGWSALAIAYGLEAMAGERDEAERRGRELAEAMATIEQERRAAQAIFDTVDVGLVLLDSEGNYRGQNRRQEDFIRLGYPGGRRDRAGQTGLVYAADGATALTAEETPTHRAARGEEFDDCWIWVGDDPLTRRALSVSARSLNGPDGGFEGAALAYKDVTEFMRALAVKEDFVASVSHELRTPLTSISGYVEMLRDRDDLPARVPEQLAVVQRNAGRLLRLISDLLHSAQSSTAPVQVSRTRCDLAAIVRHAVEAIAPAADNGGIVLQVGIPDHLWLRLDALRIAQVVDNLLSNAVKYTPGGGVVTVRLAVDGDRAELSVGDTGIGIGAADRDRLFTRFFRTAQAEQQVIQGVGLGLSIAKEIVESHGGRIEVESALGAGSTFRVRLPV